MEPLHIKYRPKTLDEVVGQPNVIKSLKSVLSNKKQRPHSYLFTGPSGCGKTTLARIVGTVIGVSSQAVVEVDAATHTGIDSARAVKEYVETPGMVGGAKRLVIIDEAHGLSKQAWTSLLKIIEEPPSHLYFALCTTESDKVPKTIFTRCYAYALHSIDYEDLLDLLNSVVEKEGLKATDAMVSLAAAKAKGSARQALVYLGMTQGCQTTEDFKNVLSEVTEQDVDAIEIARRLIGGGQSKWSDYMSLVSKLDKQNAESIRIVIVNYVAAVLKNAKDDDKASRYLAILQAFSTPYNSSERFAPLLLSIGTVLLGE